MLLPFQSPAGTGFASIVLLNLLLTSQIGQRRFDVGL
jgi:hypothetical protein